MTKDYYNILEVDKNANDADLKKAYRRLALKYHPDRNPGDKTAEETFKEVNEAYSCLSDSQKRANYDQFGTAEGVGTGFGGFSDFSSSFGDIFGDMFGDIFGDFAGRRRTRPTKGQDLRYDLEINLKEAVFGSEKKINIPRWENCSTCNGTGSKPGKGPVVCQTCKGTGQTKLQQGFFTIARTCARCGGEGKIITQNRTHCFSENSCRRRYRYKVEGDGRRRGGKPWWTTR
jgi:molecular chaperone DnaJ